MTRGDVAGAVASGIKDLLCLLASSSLLILSEPPYAWGFIAVVALVPWLVRIRRANAFGAFAMGLLLGVLFAVGAGNWIFDALAAQGATGIRRAMATLLVAVWAKGLLFAGAGWVVRRLQSRRPMIAVGVPALLFGMGEFWSSSSAWGLPLLMLGHSQISVPGVAQLAVAIGVPGISAVLFALNLSVLLVILAAPGGRCLSLTIGGMWLVAMVGGLPLARTLSPEPRGETRRLLVVQPNGRQCPCWQSADQEALLEEIAAETDRAIAETRERPDLILWPESLLTLPLEPDNRLGRRLQRQIDGWGVPVVLGLIRGAETRGGYVNSVVWWSPIRGPIASQDKVRAIPVVESSRRFPGQAILDWLIAAGADGPRVVEAVRAEPLKGEFTLATALCFEILFPRVVADRRDAESLAIVNLADDSWVAGEVLDAQLIAAGAFRAIEQRLTLIRVSHGGLSVAIDRFGKRIASLPPNRAGHMTIEVTAQGSSR